MSVSTVDAPQSETAFGIFPYDLDFVPTIRAVTLPKLSLRERIEDFHSRAVCDLAMWTCALTALAALFHSPLLLNGAAICNLVAFGASKGLPIHLYREWGHYILSKGLGVVLLVNGAAYLHCLR